MHTLANSQSATMRERALRFVDSVDCPVCGGQRLRPEALAVTFAGRTIAELVALPLTELADVAAPAAEPHGPRAPRTVHRVGRAHRGRGDDRRATWSRASRCCSTSGSAT